MLELCRLTVNIFQKYSGNSLFVLFFLLGLVYLFFIEEEKGRKAILVYGSLMILVVFFLPVFSYLMIRKVFDEEVYYRFLWMLPVNVVIAYSAVRLIKGMRSTIHRCLIALFIVMGLVAGGDYVYDNPVFAKAENLYHIPQNVIEVCDVIKPEEGEDWVMAVFPAEMLSFVRQYTAMIHMPYGRAVLIDRWSLGHMIYDTMEEDILDVEKLSNQAQECQCDYIILPKAKETTGNLEEYQYQFIQEKEGYLIYEHKSKPWEENE